MKFWKLSQKKILLPLVLLATPIVGAQFFSSYSFGTRGSSGYNGQSGYSGRDGANIVVQAVGNTENFDLRGGDGGDGQNGEYGQDANDCYQGRPNYDLVGAAGGDGGSGGNAGSGGDGGSIQVYYQDINAIRKIYVDSTPGRPGYAGEGMRGGEGCRCSDYQWQNKICWDEKRYETRCEPRGCRPSDPGCHCRRHEYYERVCDWRSFRCSDGRDGDHGMSGSRGVEGSFGSIKLIDRLEPLEADLPSLQLPIETVLNSTSTLTRHEWTRMQGALTLFAPGSRVRNDYSKYAGKTIRTVGFTWLDSKRSPDYFRGHRVSLYLTGHPASTGIEFPSNLLADAATETRGDHTQVTVQKTMRRDELVQIRVEEMTGANQDLTLVLIDDAKVSDVAKTNILIDSGWDLEGGGEYDNWVPQDLIRSEEGRIYVNIGRLPGVKASKVKKYFGEKCEFEISITREFVGHSARVIRDGGNVFDIEKDIKNKKAIIVKMENED